MVAERISPELALVCPELRAKAIAALPEQPWLAYQPKRIERPTAHAHAAEDDQASESSRETRARARAASAYVLARAGGLLAIMAAVVVLVLILADVAGAVRG